MLSRRKLLQGISVGAVTAGAALRGLLPIDVTGASPARALIWRLSPRYPCSRLHDDGAEVGARRRGCLACNACKAHAKHHLFRNKRAARRHRAHAVCHCVAYGVLVRRRFKRRLFGFPGCPDQGRDSFDTRVDSLYDVCTKGG